MNRLLYHEKGASLSSRNLFNSLRRAFAGLILLGLVSATALAQYPGAAGGTGSYPSYGSKGPVIGAVAGGAAAAGLLYWTLHRTKVQGCLAGNGDKLVGENNKDTYNLTNKQHATLKPGERVQLQGKKVKDSSGEPLFEVHAVSKDLGQCTTATAAQMR